MSIKLVTFSVVVSLVALLLIGNYFYIFLDKNSYNKAKRDIVQIFQQVKRDMDKDAQTLSDQTHFLDHDKSLLACIYLINNYEDIEPYNHILLDEEKKIILQHLLKQVEFSFSDSMYIFGKNRQFIAGVEKNDGFYKLILRTMIDKKYKFYTSNAMDNSFIVDDNITEHIKTIHNDTYKDYKGVSPQITYKISNNNLLITAHHSLFSDKNKYPVAQIEISKTLTKLNLQKYLNNRNNEIYFSQDSMYAKMANDPKNLDDIKISENSQYYISYLDLGTQNGRLFLVVKQNKQDITNLLKDSRYNFLNLFLVVAFSLTMLMYIVYNRILIEPLEILMKNIKEVNKRNFSKLIPVNTNDELESIALSVKNLANNVESTEKQLAYLAEHDELTGLYNRYHFNRTLKEAIFNIKEGENHLVLIFLDLDQFKMVNDTLGHNIGDMLLVEVSKRLENLLKDIGIVSRIGGDEFTVIVENVTDERYSEVLAKKIKKLFENHFNINENFIMTSVSMGIVKAHDNQISPERLFKHVDLALYESKEAGRNRYTFYEVSFSSELHKKSAMINELKEAIKTFNEFEIVYQPKVSMKTELPTKMEALVRWHSKKLGIISPTEFIPLAEESGLIIELGNWILQKSCEDFVELCQQYNQLEQVSVNISSVQLKQKLFLEQINDIINKSHIDRDKLEFEITERYIATDSQEAIILLEDIRKMGIGLSIDDFGTGYSSLSYLKKLPMTHIKIDKSFVEDMLESKESKSIVKAIIALSHTFGLECTAEGIEEEDELEFLRNNKCDYIQGFYYAKPMKLDDLKRYLAQFFIAQNKV